MSVKVIDEMYLNNQRAFIVFNEYFKTNQEKIMSVTEANNKEIFCFPNLLNKKHCKFIKYGNLNINEVLENSKPSYYAQSVIHQLSKTDRNFVYHIRLLPKLERRLRKFTNNGRIYQIHLNMSQNSQSIDQL